MCCRNPRSHALLCRPAGRGPTAPALTPTLCLSPGPAVQGPGGLPGEDLAAGGPSGALQGPGPRLPAPGPPHHPQHVLVGRAPETGQTGPAPRHLSCVPRPLHPDLSRHPLQLEIAAAEPAIGPGLATGLGRTWAAVVNQPRDPPPRSESPPTLFSRKFSSLPPLSGVALSQSLAHRYDNPSGASP